VASSSPTSQGPFPLELRPLLLSPTLAYPVLKMSSESFTLSAFPHEVLEDILRYCDQQTLGRTSRVSLAFLEMSGPLLYKSMVLTHWCQFQQLDRSDVSSL
jgi:hypothetical protein